MSAKDTVVGIENAKGRVLPGHDRRIGAILSEDGTLNVRDVGRVMELQQKEGLRFGEAALRLGLITADDLRSAVAKQYDLPHLLPDNQNVNSELVVAYEPFHRRSEELRALRTQLLIRWPASDGNRRALAVTSLGTLTTAASAGGYRGGDGYYGGRHYSRGHDGYRGGRNRYYARHYKRKRDNTGKYIAIGAAALMLGIIASEASRR